MPKPNFFIIGAPKCGTTALASYLAEHPNVFMSDPKEPHHYNTDMTHGYYKDRSAYLHLFRKVQSHHMAVGEASVWYLYSRQAVVNILQDIPDAKFIVMVRNPVDLARSLHEQMVFTGYESDPDFESAWTRQEDRRNGKAVPRWCTDPKLLLYKDACSVGSQLEHVLTVAPEGSVLTILYDDFRSDPKGVWQRVLKFLEVPHIDRNDFPVVNSAKARRSNFLRTLNDVYCSLRTRLGIPGLGTGLFSFIDTWNRRERPRPDVPPSVREALSKEFECEVVKLEKHFRRDLSHWRC